MDVALEVGAALRVSRLDLADLIGGDCPTDGNDPLPGELNVSYLAAFLRDVATKDSPFPRAAWTWGDPYLARSKERLVLGPAVVYLAVMSHDVTCEPWLAFGAAAADFGSWSTGFSRHESRLEPFGIRIKRGVARLRGGHSDLPHGSVVLDFDDIEAMEDANNRTRDRRDSFMSAIAPLLAWARRQVPLDAYVLRAGEHGFAEDIAFLARGRPHSGRGLYAVRHDGDERVMDEIAALDPGAEFEQEGNRVTLWVRTILVGDEIRRVPGVQHVFRSSGR